MKLEHLINLNYFIRSLPENHLFKMIFGEINNVLNLNTPPVFTASTKRWQLKFSQFSSHSHPTCQQWGSTGQRRQTITIRSSTCFRDQTSASCHQSLPVPNAATPIPGGRPQQRHCCDTSRCHINTCFRQTFSSCSTASKNSRKWGSQIWYNRKDRGCTRVSLKHNGNIRKWLLSQTCAISKHFSVFTPSQVKKSTLNPNAKEFNPIKPQMPMVRLYLHPTYHNVLQILALTHNFPDFSIA